MTTSSHFSKTCPVPSKPSSKILFLLLRNLSRLGFFSLIVFVFRALMTLQVILYLQLQPKLTAPDWFVLLSIDCVVLYHVRGAIQSQSLSFNFLIMGGSEGYNNNNNYLYYALDTKV